MRLLACGQVAQAEEYAQKSIDVTPQMAFELMEASATWGRRRFLPNDTHMQPQELRALNVPFIVAPYEADAQLAFLDKCGIAAAVISEDSDLLVFGCKRVSGCIAQLLAWGGAVVTVWPSAGDLQDGPVRQWAVHTAAGSVEGVCVGHQLARMDTRQVPMDVHSGWLRLPAIHSGHGAQDGVQVSECA
jgi:hypothetical protein